MLILSFGGGLISFHRDINGCRQHWFSPPSLVILSPAWIIFGLFYIPFWSGRHGEIWCPMCQSALWWHDVSVHFKRVGGRRTLKLCGCRAMQWEIAWAQRLAESAGGSFIVSKHGRMCESLVWKMLMTLWCQISKNGDFLQNYFEVVAKWRIFKWLVFFCFCNLSGFCIPKLAKYSIFHSSSLFLSSDSNNLDTQYLNLLVKFKVVSSKNLGVVYIYMYICTHIHKNAYVSCLDRRKPGDTGGRSWHWWQNWCWNIICLKLDYE